MIIGVVGWIGSGKGTVGDYLKTSKGFANESFAGPLKDAVAVIFGWPRYLLEGDTDASRSWRETVDPFWAEKLNRPNLTPRWVLQYMGTEVMRQGLNEEIWVHAMEHKIANRVGNTVITDVRFKNEIAMLKSIGGHIVWVRRGGLPEWYQFAVSANSEYHGDSRSAGKLAMETKFSHIHQSEWDWVGSHMDFIIENNSTIEALELEIEKVFDIIHNL